MSRLINCDRWFLEDFLKYESQTDIWSGFLNTKTNNYKNKVTKLLDLPRIWVWWISCLKYNDWIFCIIFHSYLIIQILLLIWKRINNWRLLYCRHGVMKRSHGNREVCSLNPANSSNFFRSKPTRGVSKKDRYAEA